MWRWSFCKFIGQLGSSVIQAGVKPITCLSTPLVLDDGSVILFGPGTAAALFCGVAGRECVDLVSSPAPVVGGHGGRLSCR